MRRHLFEQADQIEQEIDLTADEIIRKAAPELIAQIRDREVDEDVDEFYEGAIDAVDDMESMLDYRHPFEEKHEEPPTDSDLYRAGYEYGKANFEKISQGIQDIVDPATRIEQIKSAIKYFESRITKEAIIDALEKIYEFGKEQILDVRDLIKLAKKKYGWKAAAVAITIEIFEHFIIPGVLSTINPAFVVLAGIPTVEILTAIGLTIYKKYYKKEPQKGPKYPWAVDQDAEPSHLEWFESQNLETASHKRRGMRLSESQLRRLIRKRILYSF